MPFLGKCARMWCRPSSCHVFVSCRYPGVYVCAVSLVLCVIETRSTRPCVSRVFATDLFGNRLLSPLLRLLVVATSPRLIHRCTASRRCSSARAEAHSWLTKRKGYNRPPCVHAVRGKSEGDAAYWMSSVVVRQRTFLGRLQQQSLRALSALSPSPPNAAPFSQTCARSFQRCPSPHLPSQT